MALSSNCNCNCALLVPQQSTCLLCSLFDCKLPSTNNEVQSVCLPAACALHSTNNNNPPTVCQPTALSSFAIYHPQTTTQRSLPACCDSLSLFRSLLFCALNIHRAVAVAAAVVGLHEPNIRRRLLSNFTRLVRFNCSSTFVPRVTTSETRQHQQQRSQQQTVIAVGVGCNERTTDSNSACVRRRRRRRRRRGGCIANGSSTARSVSSQRSSRQQQLSVLGVV